MSTGPSHGERRCPRCPNAILTPGSIGPSDAEVHECRACGGAFVDERSYCSMLDAVAAGESLELGRFVPLPPGKEKPLLDLVRCPTCASEMDRARFGARSSLVIDVCGAHGIWLDAAELVSLVEVFRRLEAGTLATEDDDTDPYEEMLLHLLRAAEAKFDYEAYSNRQDEPGNKLGSKLPGIIRHLHSINEIRKQIDAHRLEKLTRARARARRK